jgi:hypothetical protein
MITSVTSRYVQIAGHRRRTLRPQNAFSPTVEVRSTSASMSVVMR